MTCEESQSLIEEYCDGELGPQTAALVARHMENCPSCGQEFQQLMLESQVYQTYDRQIEVGDSVWARISSSIAQDSPVQHSAAGSGWLQSWTISLHSLVSLRFSAPVAAALILLAIVGTVYVMNHLERKQPPIQTAAVPIPSSNHAEETKTVGRAPNAGTSEISSKATARDEAIPARPRTGARFMAKAPSVIPHSAADRTPAELVRVAEKNYLSAIAMLTRDVAQRPSHLDSETRAKLDGALASIDRTISATRRAVHKNPNDPLAVQYMLTAYAKKVDVLKEMANY